MKNILEIEFTHYPENDTEGYWYACFKDPAFAGTGESGKTKVDAFNELMLSLKVLVAFQNKVEF